MYLIYFLFFDFRQLIIYSIILEVSTVIYTLFHQIPNNARYRKLPFTFWFPYEIQTDVIFWTSFVYQVFSAVIVAMLHLATNCLTMTVMNQIWLKLDILDYDLLHLARSDFVASGIQWTIDEDYTMDSYEDEKTREKLIYCVKRHLFIFE